MKKHLLFTSAAAALLALSVFAGCSNDTPVSSVVSSETVSSPTHSDVTSQADPSDFDLIFNKNPIDPDHQQARDNAASTMEMWEVESTYAQVWKEEIDSAYQKLLDAAPAEDQAAIEKEQETWSTNLPSELDKIDEEASNGSGTMAQVTASVAKHDLYRDRAKEVYRSLYRYDPNFTYKYSSN